MSEDKFRIKARKHRLLIEASVKKAHLLSEEEKKSRDDKKFQIYLKRQAYRARYMTNRFKKPTAQEYANQLAAEKEENKVRESIRTRVRKEAYKGISKHN